PTPSGAAELVVPDQAEWQRGLSGIASKLSSMMRRQLEEKSQSLDWLARRLGQCSPAATVARQSERLKNSRARIAIAMRQSFSLAERRAERLRARLLRQSPAQKLERNAWQLRNLREQLGRAGQHYVAILQQRLALSARALDSVSPLATLQRGYAIVSEAASNKVIMDASKVVAGMTIRARLARGSLTAIVAKNDRNDNSDV
ncbi:MAG: exodeoxyribonuclease VII large subunit, partial [Woeseia sp.]